MIAMNLPAHSLHIPPAGLPAPLVGQPYQGQLEASKEVSFARCASCSLTGNTSGSWLKDSRATGFNFLCSPSPAGTSRFGLTVDTSTRTEGFAYSPSLSTWGARFFSPTPLASHWTKIQMTEEHNPISQTVFPGGAQLDASIPRNLCLF